MLDFMANITFESGFTLNCAFQTRPGITALFGRSGAGKSSLVNAIAGLNKPDRGKISINGQILFDRGAEIDLPPEARKIGYVFQDSLLFPHMNVGQNLEYGRRFRRDEQLVTTDELHGFLGIEHLLQRKPHTLSGGEQRRVAIGRALLSAPRLLLLDEPTSGLDTERRNEILKLVRQIHNKTNIPILFISHQLEEVIEIANQIIILENGEIIADTDLFDALSRPDLRSYTGQQDAGAILACQVAEVDAGDCLTRLSFDSGQLLAGKLDAKVGDNVRVRVGAADIALALKTPTDTSVLNVLSAEIESITSAGEHQTDILLRIGKAALWARITKRSLQNLELQPGMKVEAMVKAVAIDRHHAAPPP